MSATVSTKPPLGEADLRRLYIDEGKGCPEIAALVERDPTTVLTWLRKHNIPTRPRGSNPGPQFKPGHQLRLGVRHRPESVAKIKAATIARGGVPYRAAGSDQHWLKGKGPQANGRWLGGVTPERQAFYATDEWKRAIAAVWKRAHGCCERCGKDANKARDDGAFHVHHIVSFAVAALRAVVSNLALLCPTCHRFVHGKANTQREFLASEAA